MGKIYSSTKVATKHISLYDNERILVLNPSDGMLVRALAEKYRESQFLVYQSDIGKHNLLLKQYEGAPLENIHAILQDELNLLQVADKLIDVVIYQPERFIAHDLIKLQLSAGRLVLKQGGRMYLVTHTRSGASRHLKFLAEAFETEAKVIGKGGGGYRVIVAINNSVIQKQTELSVRRTVNFEVLGMELSLESESSLFSKDDLDTGTRILLENVDLSKFERMLDLGCGWGAIGIVAALVNTKGNIVLTDVDTRATIVASDNVRRFQLQERVDVIATDDIRNIDGMFELILSNPPFHADSGLLVDLFRAAHEKLRGDGILFICVEQTYLSKFKIILKNIFGNVKVHHEDTSNHFFVLSSRA